VAAHECDDIFVIADIDGARRNVASDRGRDVTRALGGDIGDGDFFDVRLVDEIVDCAVSHAAGAQNEYSHAGRMVIYLAMDAEEPVADVPVVAEEVVAEAPLIEEPPPAEVIEAVVDPHAGQRLVVIKHHALVRLSHWLNVPILFGMIVSGLSIYWASPVFVHKPNPVTHSREYLADLGIAIARHVPGATADPSWFYNHFGLGVFNLAGGLRWHWLFVYLFIANGIVYLLGLILGRGYRALLPRRTMLGESLAMVRYYAGVVPMKVLRRPWQHPEITTKYNALQRGAYASMPVAGALAVASGWAMHKPVQLWWLERMFGSYDGARIVHFVVMLYFVLFLIPHLILVLVDGWDTMRSMIVGWSMRLGGAE
jgi:thiosulfate reductase cytochrome b subunit